MKQFAFLCLFGGILLSGYSQVFQPEVFAAGGDYSQNNQAHLSWTVGEALVTSVSNSGNQLDQGFQQAQLYVTALDQEWANSLAIQIFPNPFQEAVEVAFGDNLSASVTLRIINPEGREVLREEIPSGVKSHFVNLGYLPDGIFVVELFYDEYSAPVWYRIQKSH